MAIQSPDTLRGVGQPRGDLPPDFPLWDAVLCSHYVGHHQSDFLLPTAEYTHTDGAYLGAAVIDKPIPDTHLRCIYWDDTKQNGALIQPGKYLKTARTTMDTLNIFYCRVDNSRYRGNALEVQRDHLGEGLYRERNQGRLHGGRDIGTGSGKELRVHEDASEPWRSLAPVLIRPGSSTLHTHTQASRPGSLTSSG